MTYDMDDVGPIVDGVSLITHEHADHWDRALFAGMDLELIAHPSIARGVDSSRVIPWADRMVHKGILIEPVQTEHTDAHRSYLVTWHGLRMYFTGDTESVSELLAQAELDVAFISPWLAERLVQSGQRVDARHIVIYHHLARERRTAPEGALWLEQGDGFRLPFR